MSKKSHLIFKYVDLKSYEKLSQQSDICRIITIYMVESSSMYSNYAPLYRDSLSLFMFHIHAS